MITQEKIKKLLNYDDLSGSFTWRVRVSTKRDLGSKAGCTVICSRKKYIVIGVDGRSYFAHRLAWLYVTGSWPSYGIDHADGNGANNKWANLSEANQSINGKNRRQSINNTSGVTGVCWNKQSGKWQAFIGVNTKRKYLGVFIERWDAICTRKSSEYLNGFHVNHGEMRPL